jgi:hypothetical protein
MTLAILITVPILCLAFFALGYCGGWCDRQRKIDQLHDLAAMRRFMAKIRKTTTEVAP